MYFSVKELICDGSVTSCSVMYWNILIHAEWWNAVRTELRTFTAFVCIYSPLTRDLLQFIYRKGKQVV